MLGCSMPYGPATHRQGTRHAALGGAAADVEALEEALQRRQGGELCGVCVVLVNHGEPSDEFHRVVRQGRRFVLPRGCRRSGPRSNSDVLWHEKR